MKVTKVGNAYPTSMLHLQVNPNMKKFFEHCNQFHLEKPTSTSREPFSWSFQEDDGRVTENLHKQY